MSTFRDLVEAKLHHPERVTEASLSHFYRAWIDSGEKSFAILTSWRSVDSPEKNKRNYNELRNLLRSWGYGYIRTKGNWKDIETGVSGSEPSLFVPGLTRDRAMEVMRRYGQQAVIYGGAETGGQAVVLTSDGKASVAGPWHPKKGDNWTTWKKRDFTFEALASNWSESLLEKFLGFRR